MADRYESRASTHADDCWSWGPGHYECAVRKIGELAAELREMSTERLRLRDEMDAMREDAERYRWLRENPEHGFGGGALVQVFTGHEASEFLHSHALDAAIDQARGKGVAA